MSTVIKVPSYIISNLSANCPSCKTQKSCKKCHQCKINYCFECVNICNNCKKFFCNKKQCKISTYCERCFIYHNDLFVGFCSVKCLKEKCGYTEYSQELTIIYDCPMCSHSNIANNFDLIQRK
jgi:hypothetical protein